MTVPEATALPGSSSANGPTTQPAPISASRPTVLLDDGAGADHAVDEAGVRADLAAVADDRRPCRIVPG